MGLLCADPPEHRNFDLLKAHTGNKSSPELNNWQNKAELQGDQEVQLPWQYAEALP